MSTVQRVRLVLFLALISTVLPGLSAAEPWILAYPIDNVVFRYDPLRYEVIGPAHASYDPAFSLSGQMLWDQVHGRPAVEIYQAPNLSGFTPSNSGVSEFYKVGNQTTLVIDGFSPYPRQLNDIYVQFIPYPSGAAPEVFVDGARVSGLRYHIPRLIIDESAGNGFYSDTIQLDVRWSGARKVKIIVFADKNGNKVFDGEVLYEILMEDFTIPTERSTWGAVKQKYQ